MTEHAAPDRAIGQSLRRMRLARVWTQAELAQALGVSRAAITHYEAGTRSLSAAQLVRAAQVLECSVQQLLPPSAEQTPDVAAAPALALAGPIAQITTVLQQHPELIPNVLDLLETMVAFGAEEAVPAGGELVAGWMPNPTS